MPRRFRRRPPDRLARLLQEARKPDSSLPRWAYLVSVLQGCPLTTGALGHLRGIGENVRGIRISANLHLQTIGYEIRSEPTTWRDTQGNRIPNATYRLVDTHLERHLQRTERTIAQRRQQMKLQV